MSEEAAVCASSPRPLPTIPLAEPASRNGSSASCQTASLRFKAARAPWKTERGTPAPAAAVPVGYRNDWEKIMPPRGERWEAPPEPCQDLHQRPVCLSFEFAFCVCEALSSRQIDGRGHRQGSLSPQGSPDDISFCSLPAGRQLRSARVPAGCSLRQRLPR